MTVWANGSRVMPEITSPYGYSDDYTDDNGRRIFHGGTDFINFDYNCAHENGTVIFAGWTDFGDLGGGIEIAIQHDGWVSRLLHNDSVLYGITVGTRVAEGQRVGVQGRSGYRSLTYYKKHCHDEVRIGGRNGTTTDPVPFFSARVGSSPADTDSTPFPKPIITEESMWGIIQVDELKGHVLINKQTLKRLVLDGKDENGAYYPEGEKGAIYHSQWLQAVIESGTHGPDSIKLLSSAQVDRAVQIMARLL